METLRPAAISLFFLTGFAFVVGALLGGRVKKLSIGGMDVSPFTTRGARMAAGVAGILLLTPAVALAVLPEGWTPWPSPDPSASQTATEAATSSFQPSTIPSVVPTPSLSASPSQPVPDIAEWALHKRDALEVRGIFIGDTSGTTLAAADGWLVQGFADGVVYLKPDGAVIAIYGSIFVKWLELGASTEPAPKLGYPRDDQQLSDGPDHAWQRFEEGRIQCTPVGCYLVFGEVYNQWRAYFDDLGYPTADVDPGRLIDNQPMRGWFEGGVVIVSLSGEISVCGSDGSTIASEGGGAYLCSGPLPAQP